MSIFKTFKKFLSKHADDLQSAASALGTVVAASGLGGQDRENALAAVGALVTSAKNIVDSIDTIKDTAASVTHADLKTAVNAVKDSAVAAVQASLPELIAEIVARELAKLTPPPPPAS